jgi:hypothetical protein
MSILSLPTAVRLRFSLLAILVLGATCLFFSCKKDSVTTPTIGTTVPDDPKGFEGEFNSFEKVFSWRCATGQNCQDIFELQFAKGTKVTFSVSEVSKGSTAQIALYFQDDAIGGLNQFTKTNKELRCNSVNDCNANTAGQKVKDYLTASSGTYKLAVSRDWGSSCEATGTYKLTITADRNFKLDSQAANDVVSKVKEWECK